MNRWTHPLWKFLHTTSFNWDPSVNSPEKVKHFYEHLEDIIPCKDCLKHYHAYIREHPPDVSSRKNLSYWVYKLHKDISCRLGKPSPTYEEARNMYEYGSNKMNNLHFITIGVSVAVVCIIIGLVTWYLLKKSKIEVKDGM